ncbi:MAG: DUF3662 domain-containing protein [Coriobacteriaceae bacterium]|nr:DUF3662 domain-containing protein [Coriobacteriaceae bacterium]
MGIFSRFEDGMEDAFDKAAGSVFKSPIEPAQIAKRAEKQMLREKLVGAGRQYAPTLYTVLVNPKDDRNLFGFYPTLAAEIETYLLAKGNEHDLQFDGRPLVRFIVDEQLKSGKFDVVAENVSAPTIAKLRQEEMEFYGIDTGKQAHGDFSGAGAAAVMSGAPVLGAAGLREALQQAHNNHLDLSYKSDDSDAVLDQPSFDAPAQAYARSMGKSTIVNLSSGRIFELNRTTMIIGRGDTCDVVVNDANASRNHLQLSQDATGRWKIADLDSTNGTQLNGRPVERALLRDGDRLTVGVTVFEFRER